MREKAGRKSGEAQTRRGYDADDVAKKRNEPDTNDGPTEGKEGWMDDESIMKVSSSIHSVDDRGGTDEGASERASRQGGHQSLAVVLVQEKQGRGEERRDYANREWRELPGQDQNSLGEAC